MYTRSYQRRDVRDSTSVTETVSPELQKKDLPEGYSGTALLREQEPSETDIARHFSHSRQQDLSETDADKFFTHNRQQDLTETDADKFFTHDLQQEEPHERYTERPRSAKFRVATKISPSLIQGTKHTDNEEDEECVNVSVPKTGSIPSDETERCNDAKSCQSGTDSHCCNTESHGTVIPQVPSYKKKAKRSLCHKKHSFNNTPTLCKDEKRFSLEELLLGGLILLLLNEGADDGMILIFGYLLFSSF